MKTISSSRPLTITHFLVCCTFFASGPSQSQSKCNRNSSRANDSTRIRQNSIRRNSRHEDHLDLSR